MAAASIPAEAIPRHIRHILQSLRQRGHEAVIVGGAVRDLLLHRQPKDFDLATTAHPSQVRDLFSNARIIGRRFRLVLMRYPHSKVEVATFRANPQQTENGRIVRDNQYGGAEQDALRRDFTINALMLDPVMGKLFDYTGGLDDLELGIIRTIAPAHQSLREDPVRMLRALRFKVRLNFRLHEELEAAVQAYARELGAVSRHRMAEETQRFVTGGQAWALFSEFERYGVLRPTLAPALLPSWFRVADSEALLPRLRVFLERADQWVQGQSEPIAPTVALLGVLLCLARDECRAMLSGWGAAPADKRQRRYRAKLGDVLSAWGLLNGQIKPALQILAAARTLLRQAHRPIRVDSLPGVREAWVLLSLLEGVLDIDPEFTAEGVKRLASLPDLPILDHPRPAHRPQKTTRKKTWRKKTSRSYHRPAAGHK